jgi:CRAL/TRIO domain
MSHYPERLAMECVIEPNWVFKMAYTAVKMFLTKATIEKIKLLNGL